MKIGLAVAPADAPPSAFVVFRDDLERSIERGADIRYGGYLTAEILPKPDPDAAAAQAACCLVAKLGWPAPSRP